MPKRRIRKRTKTAVAKTCGDAGGRSANGEPCTRKAGWGNGLNGGLCKDHTPEADQKLREVKKLYLEQLASGTVSHVAAAKHIGSSIANVYTWRVNDPEFAKEVEVAVAKADAVRVSIVEDSLFKRLADGDASATEMIFYLGNRAGHRWKDVRHFEHSGGAKPVEFTLKFGS